MNLDTGAVESEVEIRATVQATLDKKKWLYRIASWPNLTQILFMSSILIGGAAWMGRVLEVYPSEMRLLYDYSFTSMLAYSLSMFAETLRDRKLIGLTVDFAILLLAVVGPTGVFIFEALVGGTEKAALYGTDYWAMFGAFV